jgi:hypothetical protein
MAIEADGYSPEETSPSGGDIDSTVAERVQELSWAALDDLITDDELHLLDNLLLSDNEAVESYCDCVQLHVDLLAHFASDSAVGASRDTSPFGFPIEGTLPLGIEPQQS